jgi:hypothetical protein
MGKNVNPITKFAPQFVEVDNAEPRERTLRGKSSDCIHGTFPSPMAYDAVYIMIERTMINGAVEFGAGCGCGLSTAVISDGRSTYLNATAQSVRPIDMMGTEYSSMRRRPMRSIKTRAAHVITKLVTATDSEVSVGLEKPSMLKIVAEKYIKEFCSKLACRNSKSSM